jgi:hypothetical protein
MKMSASCPLCTEGFELGEKRWRHDLREQLHVLVHESRGEIVDGGLRGNFER